ncbi:membrane protein [Mycobacterium tuberculosis M1560]|nr:membrane protein [Mycobacterium tuberculosis M1560]
MVAAIGAVVAVAALIVALTNARPAATPATPSVPTYTAAETAAAQRQLCDTYKLVARAVPVDTNGSDKAFARIALTNAAAMLDSVETDPALDGRHRDAARALAAAYRTTIVMASGGTQAEWQAALGDVNAKEAAMKQVCGGG